MSTQDHIDKLEEAIAILQPLDAERIISTDLWKLKRELDRLKASVNFKHLSFEVVTRVSVLPLDTKLSTFRVEKYVGEALVDSVFVSASHDFDIEAFTCIEAAAEEILNWYIGDETYIYYKEVKDSINE